VQQVIGTGIKVYSRLFCKLVQSKMTFNLNPKTVDASVRSKH